MTVIEAKQALIRIGSAAARGDIDSALRDERMLYLKALQSVAAGSADAQRIAQVAVQAADLAYDRG